MSTKKKTKAWLQQHVADPFVQKAQKDGYRSRASYKLLQIQEKDKLFRPGMCILDLGAAPGGWSQVVAKIVGPTGCVVAVDRLAMDPMAGVTFIQADFETDACIEAIHTAIAGRTIDWILSDLAPDLSGHRAVDQPRIIQLGESVLEFARSVATAKTSLLIKTFQGEGYPEFYRALQQGFKTLVVRKPDASRDASRELYLLAKNAKLV